MTLFSLSDVAVDFGATQVLRDVTFTVTAGDRWGLVGRNGAGKTTLFRLLTGELAPTRGSVARRPSLRIALLEQHRDFGAARTVWEAAALGYQHLTLLERSLAEQAAYLAEAGDDATEADLTRFGTDQERFQRDGGYEFHSRVDAVLQGLGFDPESAKLRSVDGLSGGERGRLGLASQLAAPADVALLDEPTNHLDLETTDWLTRYLASFGETVLMISHDRAFLDETVDHVLHVGDGTATAYRGNYSAFATQHAERTLALERQLAQQRKYIAREEEYIRRNIAGQNSAQAKGRRSRLARLPRLSSPPGEDDAMALRLEVTERSGDQALVAERLSVAVEGRTLVRDFSSVVHRGDVIAVVGPNGAGKSTLLATLLGHRAPLSGTVRLGASVSPAWFRQDLAQVPPDRSIYECIAELRPAWGRGPIQNHLGCFGFSGDEVHRNTSVLSGGELGRVALALITLSRANLLVLDEPTNHLDVESIEALEDAIERYEGTALVVSHDRAFLRELATRVWAFDGDRIEDFDGPFVEWEASAAARKSRRAAAATAAAVSAREAAKDRARKEGAAKARESGVLREARRDATRAEEAVHAAERQVRELEAALADGGLYDGSAQSARAAADLQAQLKQARRKVEEAIQLWTRAVERLDRVEAETR